MSGGPKKEDAGRRHAAVAAALGAGATAAELAARLGLGLRTAQRRLAAALADGAAVEALADKRDGRERRYAAAELSRTVADCRGVVADCRGLSRSCRASHGYINGAENGQNGAAEAVFAPLAAAGDETPRQSATVRDSPRQSATTGWCSTASRDVTPNYDFLPRKTLKIKKLTFKSGDNPAPAKGWREKVFKARVFFSRRRGFFKKNTPYLIYSTNGISTNNSNIIIYNKILKNCDTMQARKCEPPILVPEPPIISREPPILVPEPPVNPLEMRETGGGQPPDWAACVRLWREHLDRIGAPPPDWAARPAEPRALAAILRRIAQLAAGYPVAKAWASLLAEAARHDPWLAGQTQLTVWAAKLDTHIAARRRGRPRSGRPGPAEQPSLDEVRRSILAKLGEEEKK